MKTGQNRMLVALGSVLAVGLLFAAFVAVWLVPRGPDTGSAAVQKGGVPSTGLQSGTGSAGSTQAKVGAAPDSATGFSQSAAPSGSVSAAAISDQPHISVHGTGVVAAKPDLVNLQVGVQIQNQSLDAAQTDASTKMDATMQQLKASGVEDKDIATSQYNVEPVMNYRDNLPPEVTGFRVTNILNVKVRDISKAGKLIDSLIKSGANTVYGLSFGFSDPTAIMKQAREQAMNEAKTKATELATLGGLTLGAPILIEDGGGSVPPPVMQAAGDTAARGVAPSAAPVINPGQQDVQVEVNVVYSIK